VGRTDSIDCNVQAGQAEHVVRVAPNSDVYVVHQWDSPSGFRFAAQWLKPSNQLKTYVYYHGSKNRYALVHASEKMLSPQDCDAAPSVHRVFSERMEYELIYRCRLVCDTAPVADTKGAP